MSYSFERIGKLLEGRGLRLAELRKVADKSWSPTDCASFQVLEAGRAFISGESSGKGGGDICATAGNFRNLLECMHFAIDKNR